METTLHRQLKTQYGPDRGGRAEVTLATAGGRPRIDAVGPDGELIEIQASSLFAIRAKVSRLLEEGHRVRVVKPLPVRRRIIHRDRPDGPDRSARRSPWKGSVVDVFPDLVGFVPIFPNPGLSLDLLTLAIDEVRVSQRRRPGFRVVDRRLDAIEQVFRLVVAADLWNLIPTPLPDPFTTLDVTAQLDCSMWLAQQIAYCLRLTGAASVVGKRGNRIRYSAQTRENRRPDSSPGIGSSDNPH